MLKPVAPELPPRYYLDNFQALCDSVFRQYQDVLTGEERDFYRIFSGLGEDARCFYVRLASRKGPLFRSAALSYPELGPLQEAADELCEAGLLQASEPELEDLCQLYRKSELKLMFAELLPAPCRLSKADMVELLESLEMDQASVAGYWYDYDDEPLWQPLGMEVVALFQVLFFGNRYQGLTDFVLSDLGVARYVSYPLEADFRLFASREEIDEYLALGELGDIFYEAVELGDEDLQRGLVAALERPVSSEALRPRQDSLRNRVARQLERIDSGALALEVYLGSKRHPARERSVRVLQSAGRFEPALALCEDIVREPWCEAELDFAVRQQSALRKKMGLEYEGIPRSSFPEEKVELEPGDESVEFLAAAHLGQEWAEVHYVENTLVNGLFGLALWEEIFMPLPGAFVNPFQSTPLDMDSPEFYRRRREAIDARLGELAQMDDLRGELLECFERYRDLANRWVNWRYLDRQLLGLVLDLVPADHLLAMWRRILFDPGENRSGFPDLIALDPRKGYCMVEVKGPGDQLQLNQKRWLRFFREQGIPWTVLRVEWRQ